MQKLFTPEQLRVLAVNIGEDEETVFGFIPDTGFTILLDQKSAGLRAWQVRGLPATFIADPEGRIALKAVGGREFDDPAIVAQLRALLRPGGHAGPDRRSESSARTRRLIYLDYNATTRWRRDRAGACTWLANAAHGVATTSVFHRKPRRFPLGKAVLQAARLEALSA